LEREPPVPFAQQFAAEQEDLVVHREAEQHAEQQDGIRLSIKPLLLKFRMFLKLPHWKMKTSTP